MCCLLPVVRGAEKGNKMEYLEMIALEFQHATERVAQARRELAEAEDYFDQVLNAFCDALMN